MPALERMTNANGISHSTTRGIVRLDGMIWARLDTNRNLSSEEVATAFHEKLVNRVTGVALRVTGALVIALAASGMTRPVRAMQQESPSAVVGPRDTVVQPGRLRSRRTVLPNAAGEYYRQSWAVADIHVTEADDRATIVRSGDGIVDVSLQSGNQEPWFWRRFDARETQEIRLYLHDGNDTVVVTGHPRTSILVRVIGGNGNNAILDSSTVGGQKHPTRRYDVGVVTDVRYAPDPNKPETAWNRRPLVKQNGTLVPDGIDHGAQFVPSAGVSTGRRLGVVPRVGLTWYDYGFRNAPYRSMVRIGAAYSTKTNGVAVHLTGDRRFEGSPLHVSLDASKSQLALVEFHGFGNDVSSSDSDFYRARQTQYLVHPSLGMALGHTTNLSLGPVLKYVSTDSMPNDFIAQKAPYGFGKFDQVGVLLDLHHDGRDRPANPHRGFTVDLSGAAYPAFGSLRSPFEKISALSTAYFTIPALSRPVLAVRAGAEQLFGEFPYYEAAALGGSSTIRTLQQREFVGDAALHGGSELRLPVARFPFIVPLDVGLLGVAEAGRIYMNGSSPGGWHSMAGTGMWVGFRDASNAISVIVTNQRARRVMVGAAVGY
jgi:hypothetical protein